MTFFCEPPVHLHAAGIQLLTVSSVNKTQAAWLLTQVETLVTVAAVFSFLACLTEGGQEGSCPACRWLVAEIAKRAGPSSQHTMFPLLGKHHQGHREVL